MRMELSDGGFIEANKINIGDNVVFGKNVQIKVRGTFSIGSDSYVGDRFTANGENIEIGDFFFNIPTDNGGMIIGGGSSNFPYANLKIGHRMVCHTGQINLARPVTIGDDVGLSHDVGIITHGFWASALDGYPYTFAEVNIGNNVIVGWRSAIMSGVTITNNVVIGAQSTVVKSLEIERAVYAGTPAKFIRGITEPTTQTKVELLNKICNEFIELMKYYEEPIIHLDNSHPIVILNGLTLNTETLECHGTHDIVTDAFRDFMRRYGMRFFVKGRKFGFNLTRK